MIRGKAMEYNAFFLLNSTLPHTAWSIQKLNLNAQTGNHDKDISITHRRTGIILKVESKSAVRGSISDGKRAKIIKEPHFIVKCHRSRSNIKLADTLNDQYSVDTFDVIITNLSNAIIQGNTVGENLEIIYNKHLKAMLFDFYKISTEEDLLVAAENDWRFCIPKDIAENGYIPRTPYVKLSGDENWKPVSKIEERLLKVVEEKRRNPQITRRN
jgi:hypothetical protein